MRLQSQQAVFVLHPAQHCSQSSSIHTSGESDLTTQHCIDIIKALPLGTYWELCYMKLHEPKGDLASVLNKYLALGGLGAVITSMQ